MRRLMLLAVGLVLLVNAMPTMAQEVEDPTPTRENWITPGATADHSCATPEIVSQAAPEATETPIPPVSSDVGPPATSTRGLWLSFGEYLIGLIIAMVSAGGFTLAGLFAGLRSKGGKDQLEALVMALLPDALRESVAAGLQNAGEVLRDVGDVFDGKPNEEAIPRG